MFKEVSSSHFVATPRASLPGLALALALGASACAGAARPAPHSALAAGHTATMTALGYVSIGSPTSSTVPANGVKHHAARLEAGRCYRVVALSEGSGGASAPFELALVDARRQRVSTGAPTSEGHGGAALRYCASESGAYAATVAAASHPAAYFVSFWLEPDASGGNAETAPGTCAAPLPLALGGQVEGSTAQARDNATGSCLRGRGPDVIYALDVPSRQRVTLTVRTDFDAALYLQRTCGHEGDELSCCNLAVSRGTSRIDTVLEAGRYFVVVDTLEGGRRGTFTLSAARADAPELARVCASLPALEPGTPARGDTSGRADLQHGSCAAGNFPGPDRAYRVTVTEPSRVRATLSASGDWDPGLYLRRDCMDPASELACNDDAGELRFSQVRATLAPGAYTLVVDGYVAGSQGAYELELQRTSAAGAGLPRGERCAEALPLEVASVGAVHGDTFDARDDHAGSCGGAGAPDLAYRVVVPRRSYFRATLASDAYGDRGRLYLTRTCGAPRGELACGARSVDAVLDPGTYFLVVDGADRDAFGNYTLQYRFDDPATTAAACRAPTPLPPGVELRGETAAANRLEASCGGGARGGEKVYTLRLAQRRWVEVAVHSEYDAVLSLRRDCARGSSELACNDDDTSTRDARIARNLDAGTYYVVVDGYGEGAHGAFRILATLGEPRPDEPASPAPSPASTLRDPGAGTNPPGAPVGNPCGGSGANPCGANPCGGAPANPCGGAANPCQPPSANPCGAAPTANPCAGR